MQGCSQSKFWFKNHITYTLEIEDGEALRIVNPDSE